MAPRHPIRGDEVAKLTATGKAFFEGRYAIDKRECLYSYGYSLSLRLHEASDIAWLGATFSGKGGHNLLKQWLWQACHLWSIAI